MDDVTAEIGGGEFAVVAWVLVSLALWWGAMYLWREYAAPWRDTRRRKHKSRRRHHRLHHHEHDQADQQASEHQTDVHA